MYDSDTKDHDNNPTFKKFKLKKAHLCREDDNLPLVISAFHKDPSGNPATIEFWQIAMSL